MGTLEKHSKATRHIAMPTLLNLTPTQAEKAFKLYDIDNSSSLEPEEIEKLANSLSLSFTKNEILDWIKSKYGENADSINKEQFLELIQTAFEEHNEMVMSFRYFDKNNDGEITYEELKIGIKKLYKEKKIEKISKADLKRMFKDADKDDNKRISFEEFVEILNNEL